MERRGQPGRASARHAIVALAGTIMLAACGSAMLAACGSADPAPSQPTADVPAGKGHAIAAGYVRAHGGPIDACFGPPPAIRGPGDIQTVSDDPASKPAVIDRLVVAIDASGSMAARVGGETKMDAARRAAIAFLRGVPTTTPVGLVAFGQRGSNLPSGKTASCRGVETIYPLGSADPARVASALGAIRPTGWTPLASAITTAGRSFTATRTPGTQVVFVVSDGLETCGGDPIAAARTLNAGPVKAIVNIIGFDLTPADRAQLSAVASAGGGTFVEARTGDELGRMLDTLRRKARSVSAISTEYVDGTARASDNNRAVGRYATTLNQCVTRATAAEMTGVLGAVDAAKATGADRDTALADLRRRHDAYRDRSSKAYEALLARVTVANDAIAAQQQSSEKRLGINP